MTRKINVVLPERHALNGLLHEYSVDFVVFRRQFLNYLDNKNKCKKRSRHSQVNDSIAIHISLGNAFVSLIS